MSVAISLMKKGTYETIERYIMASSSAIHDVWIPLAKEANLGMLSELGAIMGFDDISEVTAFRNEFVELKRFIVQSAPTKFKEYNYSPKALLDRIDHVIAMLDKAIKDNSLHVHCS